MFFRILAIIFSIIGIGVIVFGQMEWKEKAFVDAERPMVEASDGAEVTTQKNVETSASLNSLTKEELSERTSLLPEEVQKAFLNAFEGNQSVSLLVLGSDAMGDSTNGVAQSIKAKLQGVYGTQFLQVDTFTYDGSSFNFVEDEDGLESIGQAYDLVLYEPFTFNDNGVVEVSQNHEHTEEVMGHFEALNKDTKFILHPPQPMHEATIYPTQVEDLKVFAEEKSIPYIDVWKVWPDYDTDELTDYLDSEGNVNPDGIELWSNEVVHYFTND
ncbi:hypothetical protein D3H55_06295 [Bacillus salacetis]|uniref:SGNH/GDSL hydrolase family protein n=1 Tax=Bacillus salacetis TaxID=2315464 RepID=A0A3A1R3Q2_9BACI|nr:hypothetical protein [Bacillus salacetis]RIW36065.1 hypothetical protein D3H55_06295 [Bacillus salacetis]